ncbi:hypothetical protein PILCRDRAFT_95783 [Piloderma croceum F 1598]|uniref:Mitochondrial carrier protein n=1 Tax=Piloderma croceum (strain F 1598) TaxID=765440 RepID=A0A0C3BM35_PILCF|nr:hypothetical protein PILCRDRAFT_95783 [Piloderma croceum F 1598]
MSTAVFEHGSQEQPGNSLYAALARTATRSVALYFSRPVRLFRPAKVSGWQSLRGLAAQHGQSLSAEYMASLVKKHGLAVIPKHFVPPIIINACLGTVLWETYALTYGVLEPHLNSHPTITAALSGGTAGGLQALVAAPAENVRLVLEGGSGAGWSSAWKDVFRGTVPISSTTTQRENVRQVRDWMTEVRGMAGRGWDGWGWGCAKDVCGFATFFAIFEITRRGASRTKFALQNVIESWKFGGSRTQSVKRHFPRIVHGITLVSGGVIAGIAYEVVSRPFDVARKVVQQDRIAYPRGRSPGMVTVMQKVRQDGFLVFFRDSFGADHSVKSPGSAGSRRIYAALRTLARVGPWGIGFLVWEAFGPGLS